MCFEKTSFRVVIPQVVITNVGDEIMALPQPESALSDVGIMRL